MSKTYKHHILEYTRLPNNKIKCRHIIEYKEKTIFTPLYLLWLDIKNSFVYKALLWLFDLVVICVMTFAVIIALTIII